VCKVGTTDVCVCYGCLQPLSALYYSHCSGGHFLFLLFFFLSFSLASPFVLWWFFSFLIDVCCWSRRLAGIDHHP
jgi:hypothetical protein